MKKKDAAIFLLGGEWTQQPPVSSRSGDSAGEGGLILLPEGRVRWGGRDGEGKKCHIQVVTWKENVIL